MYVFQGGQDNLEWADSKVRKAWLRSQNLPFCAKSELYGKGGRVWLILPLDGIVGRENLNTCGHIQQRSVIFPCISMMTTLDACAGGKAATTQCH